MNAHIIRRLSPDSHMRKSYSFCISKIIIVMPDFHNEIKSQFLNLMMTYQLFCSHFPGVILNMGSASKSSVT